MSEFGLLCLQFYAITLLCVLVGMVVTPFAIWLDNIEEKSKQKNQETIERISNKKQEIEYQYEDDKEQSDEIA